MASKAQQVPQQPNPPVGKIKKEPPDYEMKEYAENAMKEMLGWYGYTGAGGGGGGGGGADSDGGGGPGPGPGGTSSDPEATCSSSGRPSPSPPHNIPAGCMCCAWCQKVGNAKQFNFKTPGGNKVFCSELCFTQCRRANFKRNKTCDWCRHVRHTVNYVDFQDGDHQLQFCSDKCLNQYKMNIFCKETQAHLELHPHIQDAAAGSSANSGTGNLITPELWMRDCRSQSPDTDRSPTPPRIPSPLIEIKMSPPPSPTPHHNRRHSAPFPPQKKSIHKETSKRKMHRAKKPAKPTPERTSSSSPRSGGSVSPPKSSQFTSPLPHHVVPPPHFLSHDHPHRPPLFFPPGFLPPPHMFPDVGMRFPGRGPPPPRKGPPPPPGCAANIPPLLPISRPPLQPPPLLPLLPHHSFLPPPTTLVPYPLFVPIPIPIPIPIPLPGIKLGTPLTNGVGGSSPPSAPPEETLSVQNKPPVPEQTSEERGSKMLKSSTPHRKRKRLADITTEDDNLCKPKSVHA